jgi:acyl-coenzyme A thioesterase PaaI-like protein
LEDGNPFRAIYERYHDRPAEQRAPLVTHAVGQTIPFVVTVGAYFETYTPTEVVVRLDNRPAVQNHFGGLHAAALGLLAETATGLVTALNLTPPAVPLLRTMDLSFQRRAQERVRARAILGDADTERIRSRPVGKVDVAVQLTNDDGSVPVDGTLQWAWLPRERVRG